MKKSYHLIACLVIGLLFICGCSKNSSSSSKGKEVNLALISELTSGDLATVTDTNTFTMFNNVQEGLYRFDENNHLQKALVKEDPQKSSDLL